MINLKEQYAASPPQISKNENLQKPLLRIFQGKFGAKTAEQSSEDCHFTYFPALFDQI